MHSLSFLNCRSISYTVRVVYITVHCGAYHNPTRQFIAVYVQYFAVNIYIKQHVTFPQIYIFQVRDNTACGAGKSNCYVVAGQINFRYISCEVKFLGS